MHSLCCLHCAEPEAEPIKCEFDVFRGSLRRRAEGLFESKEVPVEPKARFDVAGVEVDERGGEHVRQASTRSVQVLALRVSYVAAEAYVGASWVAAISELISSARCTSHTAARWAVAYRLSRATLDCFHTALGTICVPAEIL